MKERKPFASTVSFFFSVFMLAIYLLIAVAVAVFQWPQGLPRINRIILVAAIVVYVAYRAYKLVQKRKEEKQTPDV